MKRIPKKTLLNSNQDYSYKKQDSEKVSEKIEIKNPIIQTRPNYSEYIQKKYSRQSSGKTNDQIRKTEEGYLQSDLDDADNKKIYENVIQRMEEGKYQILNRNDRRIRNYSIDMNSQNYNNTTNNQNNNNYQNSYKPSDKYTKKYSYNINDNTINSQNNNNCQNSYKPSEKYTKKYSYNINDANNNQNNNKYQNSYKPSEKYTKKYSYNINNNTSNSTGYKYNINQTDKGNNNTEYKYNVNQTDKKSTRIISSNRSNFDKVYQKKDENNEENKDDIKLKRQTLERGGKFNNVQVTHVIYSKKDLPFHIAPPEEITISNIKSKYSGNIVSSNVSNVSRRDSKGSIKMSNKTSVDAINFIPNNQKSNQEKITSYYYSSAMKLKKDFDNKISSIPNPKSSTQTNFYKPDKKTDYSKSNYTNYKNNIINQINNNNTTTYNNYTNNKTTSYNNYTNNKTTNYSNYTNYTNNYNNRNNNNNDNKNENINYNKSGSNQIVYSTPIKREDRRSNYIKTNSNNNVTVTNNSNVINSRNSRYNNYINTNKDSNITTKKTDYKEQIYQRNVNNLNQNKPISNNNQDKNKTTQIKIDYSKYMRQPKKTNENIEIPNNKSIEIKKITEDINKRPENLKTDIKTSGSRRIYYRYNNESQKKEKEKEDKKINKEESENIFFLKNYFKIFKNKINNNKEYEKWFKRNCDNNNDVSKKNIITKYLYFSPKIKNNKDLMKMPYDEWFNRHCEKSENIIKKQKKENEKKLIFNKLQNIINKDEKNDNKLNNELNKLNNEEKKEVLNDLRNSVNNISKKRKLDDLIGSFVKKQKEEEKSRLIKSARNTEIKQKLEDLVKLWNNDDIILPQKEKEIKFEELNKLFKDKKRNKLIEELNNLDKKDKDEALDYLRKKNRFKNSEINDLDQLSEKHKKIDVLVNALAGKRKINKKEKLKKIVDILLNLDKKTKKDCVYYMKNTAEDDEQKNNELLSIIKELPSEEREEYENFDLDKNNYSYSYSNSFEKNFEYTTKKTNEDIKEETKNKSNEKEEDLKLLDDDIYDIVNEIQNADENQKIKLTDDEFKDFADNIVFNLYENKIDDDEDYSDNDEDIKSLVHSLNNLNKEDRNKAVDILKQNADDEEKKKKLSKLRDRMRATIKAKKLIKNLLEKKNNVEEDDNFAENMLDELESQTTILMDNNDNSININNNNNIKIHINNNNLIIDKIFDDNMIKSMELKKPKLSLNNTVLDKFKKSLVTTKFIVKLKQLKNKRNEKSLKLKNEENLENLDSNKLKEILKCFEKDLYEENEKPLTRKEARENEMENKNKLKEISKVLEKMNKSDQEEILNKLKIKANNEYKNSQYDKLQKIIKNIKYVKSLVEQFQSVDDEFRSSIKNEKLMNNELDEIVNNLAGDLFNDNNNNNERLDTIEEEEEIIERDAEIISHLNKNQQDQIIDSLLSKAKSKNNEEIIKRLSKSIELLNGMKQIVNSLTIEKKNITENNEENPEDLTKKEKIVKKNKIKLNDNEITILVEAILDYLFKGNQKDNKKLLNETDKYLLNKEIDKKIENTANILKNLIEEDKEMISGILAYILYNDEKLKILMNLNEKIGIKRDIKKLREIIDIYEDFKNEDNIEELKNDKLAELTEELIMDLMKNSPEDKEPIIDKINKIANIIILLNKKDQVKILHTLNDFAKNDKQKEIMEKINNLVENLNYMNFYLYNVDKKCLSENKDSEDLNEVDYKNLKRRVFSEIFNDYDENNYNSSKKNINKIALTLSTLNYKNQNKLLSELNQESNEHFNSRKSIVKLKETLNNIKMSNIVSSILKSEKGHKKKKITDNEMKLISDNINEILNQDKISNNFTTKLLFDKHQECKINQLTKTIYNHYDEESQRKTMNYLTQSIFTKDKNNKNINKIRDSIMNIKKNNDANNKNIFTSQFYMNKSLGGTDLNDIELNLLIETFCKDLFNDENKDNNIKEENLNLIANLIKELHEENQNKVIEKLEKKPEAKNRSDLIENLRERVLKLRVLKDELTDKQKDKSLLDPNKSINFNNSNVDDLLENEEEIDQTMTVEISVDEEEIDQEDLNEICKVFKVEYDDEDNLKSKSGENEKQKLSQNDKRMSLFASSITRLGNKKQKQITQKIQENISNENEKEQFALLLERIKLFNNFKQHGREIKEKQKKKTNQLEDEIHKIEILNRYGTKNLEKENLNKLEDEIINNLYQNENINYDKNEEIKKYIIEAKNEEKIKNAANKIIALSLEDKTIILNKLENLADNEDKKRILNSLFKMIDNIEKINELKKPIKKIEFRNINSADYVTNEKLQKLAKQLEKSMFNDSLNNSNNKSVYIIADQMKDLNLNNQQSLIKILKEKADDDDKKNEVKKLSNYISTINSLKQFKKKVIEKHLNKIALEKIENENKYGIVKLQNENNKENPGMVIIKKPQELNEEKLNRISNRLIEDLININEEENNFNEKHVIDRYLKEKEDEKKLEDMSDVINSLDINDKNEIIKRIRNNFDNTKKNSIYNKFIKILAKKERQFDEEKRKKQKEAIKELEEAKNEKSDFLYSFKTEKNESSDIVNIGEYYQDYNNEEINSSNCNKWTHKKGCLETEEIY